MWVIVLALLSESKKKVKLTDAELKELGNKFNCFDAGLKLAKEKRAIGELGKLSKLNDAELAAIHSFTANGDKINSALQAGVDNEYTAKMVNLINSGIDKGSETIKTAYRGAALRDEYLREYIDAHNNKTTIEHNRFMSTSIDRDVTENFSQTSSKRPNKVLYIINNAKGAFIEPITDFAGEKELLLKSGSKFVVDKIENKHENNKIIICLTQL